MNVYTMYFSPTGGTRRVARILAGELNAPVEMDFSLPGKNYGMYRFEPGDVCFVAVPSFGGRVPKAAYENLTKVRAHGAAAVAVVTYGNRAYEDTLLELRKALEGCGFKVVAAVAAVTEHSIMRQYGEGRPDKTDRQTLKVMAREIKKKLLKPESWKDFFVPGHYPYKEYHTIPLTPVADRSCSQCGLCAKRCPVRAISRKNPEKTDTDKCISCMRCVSICPQHSRKVNKMMVFAASVKLKKACSGHKNNELFL